VGKAEPTPEALEAARELLARDPTLASRGDSDDIIRQLARLCDEIGVDRFRVQHGLQTPRTPFEQATADYTPGA
jgi:hypothetical protein